jgi:hypothetical protein
MKKTVIFPALILSAVAVNAQTTNVAMGQEFQELAAHGGLSGKGFASFQQYTSGEEHGSQFFFPEWTKGEVVTTRKEVFNEGMQFVYDKVNQELYIRKADSSLVLQTNKDEIQSFSLKDDNNVQYNFVNSKLFSDDKQQVFYQVLVYDSSRYTLLKYIKTKFQKAPMTEMMNQREGNVYDGYVDKYVYYILKPDDLNLHPVQLNPKNIKKVFGELEIPYEVYMNAHIEPTDEDYLVKMVRQLNK